MSWPPAFTFVRRSRSTKGQVALFAPVLLTALIGGFAALAVDMGSYVRGRQQVENAVDAAALAGAQKLPDDGTTAVDLARQYARDNGHDPNDSSIPPDKRPGLNISFRCIVGDRDRNGSPDAGDIPAICPQVDPSSFRCEGGLCIGPCNFSGASNKCNTIVVDGSKYVPFYLAPVLGVSGLTTGTIRGSACRGFCGTPPTISLDMVLIIDRTGSMDASDLSKAKSAALAVLQLFNPERQHVALGVLGPSKPTDLCASAANGNWLPVPLSADYKISPDSPDLNMASPLVHTITCLGTSNVGTNLGDPMLAAKNHLLSNGRPGVKKGIILLTDGAPTKPDSSPPCLFASQQADSAKKADIEIFTIGFGVEGESCAASESSDYRGKPATKLLADMATNSLDDHNHCGNAGDIEAENADKDNFLCQPKDEDLVSVFTQAAAALAGGSRLVYVPLDQ